jgi:MFS family permease
MASGVMNSPFATLYNLQVPAEMRSSMLSIQSLSSYVGGILGSVVLGFVANTVSIGLAWAVAGALLLVSLPLYLKLDSREANRIEQHEPETAVL